MVDRSGAHLHVALAGLCVLLLAGCGSSGTPTAGATPAAAAPSTAPEPTVPQEQRYALGASATASAPVPPCPEAVANWTAATGEVVVMVFVAGPTQVTVTVDGHAAQVGTIGRGQHAHDFHFPDVQAAAVRQVLVAAPDNPDGPYGLERGGKCLAPGSATA